MKKIAYIITSQSTPELMEDNLLNPILKGEHGAQITAFYFVGDGVYHLVKGSRIAKNLKSIALAENIPLFACEISIRNRKFQNIIIDGIKRGTLEDFYNAAADADHIISF